MFFKPGTNQDQAIGHSTETVVCPLFPPPFYINVIPIDIYVNDNYITRAMNDPTHYIFKAYGVSLLNGLRGVAARKW